MQTGKGELVASLAVMKPEGYAGNSGGGDVTFFGNGEIGDFILEHLGDLPTSTNCFELLDGHEITEKVS
ncbi:MAG: hypothetical protein UX37_C0027G0011 [Microgenomates group bacterium GW2011_GWA2_46_16]|nr:MAG: hypothetical protein UX37_C0027G0011 [Microgenomates group bacterium GW2011_GWA2_46_16]